jgi:hypothetical protein
MAPTVVTLSMICVSPYQRTDENKKYIDFSAALILYRNHSDIFYIKARSTIWN